MSASFFSDMLQTVSEHGRVLIDKSRLRRESGAQCSEELVDLCEDVLSGRGEASGAALARECLARYAELGSRSIVTSNAVRRLAPAASRELVPAGD